MPISDDDMIVSSKDFFVTESTLNPKATPVEIQDFLRRTRTTGKVVTDLRMGGVQQILLTEKTLARGKQEAAIRSVMGMPVPKE